MEEPLPRVSLEETLEWPGEPIALVSGHTLVLECSEPRVSSGRTLVWGSHGLARWGGDPEQGQALYGVLGTQGGQGGQCWPGLREQAPCGSSGFLEGEPIHTKLQRVLSETSRMKSWTTDSAALPTGHVSHRLPLATLFPSTTVPHPVRGSWVSSSP